MDIPLSSYEFPSVPFAKRMDSVSYLIFVPK
jgi:hypothetical protein